MADLFDAPPAPDAPRGPRPLADRLRPKALSEVIGQDHLLGPGGALRVMLDAGSLGSLVFWGPPGVGKTTIARLLAEHVGLTFEQISAVFSGVADLRKVFETARHRRRDGQGTLLFVDEITASTGPSRTASCRSSRTARWCSSARRRKTPPSN